MNIKKKTKKENAQFNLNGVSYPFKLIDKIGFDSMEVYKQFKKQGRGKQWENFINGSTGAISKKGIFLVYPWDVETFVKGLPNYD